MLKENVQAIILAAGKSTRLKTGQNKMIEKICGQPMIIFVTKLFKSLEIATTIVVGYQKDLITRCIDSYHKDDTINYVFQEDQHGTAHALNCTHQYWQKDHILVMNGDMPLVTAEIIQSLYEKHIASNATVSFAIAHHTEPSMSYGRVVTTENKIKIVEAKEFKDDSADHCCINAGIYLIKKSFLEKHIHDIKPNDISREFHITDLIAKASEHNEPVATVNVPFDYVRGINNQHELWTAEQVQRSNIIKHWMEHGVRFSVAHNVHIDLDVTIGQGSYIGCGVHLLYGTKIGLNCKIHEYSILENVIIGNNSTVYPFSVIKDSSIGNEAQVGPFAHIHTNTSIANQTTIGNFVEIKNSSLESASKAKHLTYIGDATIGKNSNIGAGTIICNFDGKNKHQTVIENDVFIGSNNTLVAPVTISNGAFTAAGSTITQDVPPHTLAIARSQQIHKLRHCASSEQHNMMDNEFPQQNEFTGAILTNNDLLIKNDTP